MMMNAPICQCCAMPMTEDSLFGTNKDGSKNEDYCAYCFKGGEFTFDGTMDEMIEFCVQPCLDNGVYPDADTARKSMKEFFPSLKRWKG